MRIPCPYCGERSNDEFVVKGDADAYLTRPTSASQDAFHDHLYLRSNAAGAIRELWYHQGGCRQWLVVSRDTRTHAVGNVLPARMTARAGGTA